MKLTQKKVSLLVLVLCCFFSFDALQAQTPVPTIEQSQITPFEEESLRIEWVKALGTIGALLVPLGLGVITLRNQAKTAFQIKAIELLMQSPTPWIAEKRALVMENMFPDRLEGFAERFDYDDFPGVRLHEMKLELIRLIAQNPEKRADIVELWKQQFPKDVAKFGL